MPIYTLHFAALAVKDGLVSEPSDWPYSNYLEWMEARPGTLVDRDFIRDQFFNSAEYRSFVYDYLKSRRLPDDVKRYLDEIEKS